MIVKRRTSVIMTLEGINFMKFEKNNNRQFFITLVVRIDKVYNLKSLNVRPSVAAHAFFESHKLWLLWVSWAAAVRKSIICDLWLREILFSIRTKAREWLMGHDMKKTDILCVPPIPMKVKWLWKKKLFHLRDCAFISHWMRIWRAYYIIRPQFPNFGALVQHTANSPQCSPFCLEFLSFFIIFN